MLINTLKTFLTLTFLVTFGDTLTLSLKSLSGQFPFIQHYRDNVWNFMDWFAWMWIFKPPVGESLCFSLPLSFPMCQNQARISTCWNVINTLVLPVVKPFLFWKFNKTSFAKPVSRSRQTSSVFHNTNDIQGHLYHGFLQDFWRELCIMHSNAF